MIAASSLSDVRWLSRFLAAADAPPHVVEAWRRIVVDLDRFSAELRRVGALQLEADVAAFTGDVDG